MMLASRLAKRQSVKISLTVSEIQTIMLSHSILIYTVGSLQAKYIVKMSSIFLPVLRHKDFFGWVTSLQGEKNVSNFFRLF